MSSKKEYTFLMKNKETEKAPFVKKNYYTIADAGWGYFCAIVAPYAVMAVVIIIMGLLSSQTSQNMEEMTSGLAFTIISSLFAPIGYSILFFAFNKKSKTSFKAVNLRFNIKMWDFVMCFVVAIICLFGLQYFIGGFNLLLQKGGYELTEISLPLDNIGYLILAIFLMAVLPAVFEELIFRGIILNGLKGKMGDVYAILLSAGMFAFAHGSIEQFVYQFALGVVIAWMVVRTGSLLSGIIVHFLNNAMVLIFAYLSQQNASVELSYNVWQWVLSVVLVLIACVLIYLIEKFYFKHKNRDLIVNQDEKISENEKLAIRNQPYPLILWFGIGVAVALFLINTLSGFGVFNLTA